MSDSCIDGERPFVERRPLGICRSIRSSNLPTTNRCLLTSNLLNIQPIPSSSTRIPNITTQNPPAPRPRQRRHRRRCRYQRVPVSIRPGRQSIPKHPCRSPSTSKKPRRGPDARNPLFRPSFRYHRYGEWVMGLEMEILV